MLFRSGRTQGGNNNAYCQDNETSWFDWERIDRNLLEYTRRLIHLQATHPAFRRRGWFNGRGLRGAGVADIAWFRPDGKEMVDEDWQHAHTKSFAVFLNGDALRELDEDGRPVRDQSFLLLFNAHHEPLAFTLPGVSFGRTWDLIIDTAAGIDLDSRSLEAGKSVVVPDRTILVLSRASAAR